MLYATRRIWLPKDFLKCQVLITSILLLLLLNLHQSMPFLPLQTLVTWKFTKLILKEHLLIGNSLTTSVFTYGSLLVSLTLLILFESAT